jgi:Cu/Ag efflux protein CusF
MDTRAFASAFLLCLLILLAGCGSDDSSSNASSEGDAVRRTTYADVRGRFLGTATGGRDVVIHHEAIPDLMGAMIMTLPIADTADLAPIEKNDPIKFDLVIDGSNLRAENVEALPDTVTLKLGDDGPAEDDTTGAEK